MKETNVSRTTAQRAPATSYASPAGEKTGQMAQAFRRATIDHHHIAQRAYELYARNYRGGISRLDDGGQEMAVISSAGCKDAG